MTVKTIVEEWLKEHGYDGLCCPEAECGCLLSDFAPCGEAIDACRPGHRVEIDKHAVCGCEGQGSAHWHVEYEYIDPKEWQCECGKQCDPDSSEWRWNGRDWEHHHGYPIGHVTATRKPRP